MRDGLFRWSEKCYFGLLTHILARGNDLKLKRSGFVSHKHSFSLQKSLSDGLEWCGLL